MAQHLPVPYHKQFEAGYCMAACVQMVLAYQNVTHSQEEIAKLLKIQRMMGAPTRNIRRMTSKEISVIYEEGTLTHIKHHLESGKPIIAFVQAGELTYWQSETFQHAIVVIGYDDGVVWILDPDGEADPISVKEDEFMLAWIGMDYLYAVLSVQEIES